MMMCLIAAAQLAFVATDIFWISVSVFVVWGFVLNGSGIICQSLIQATVPDTIRGRVVSLYGMLWLGTPALGAFAMGVAADYLGFRIPVAAGAIVIVVTFVWSLTRRKRLRESIDTVAKETL